MARTYIHIQKVHRLALKSEKERIYTLFNFYKIGSVVCVVYVKPRQERFSFLPFAGAVHGCLFVSQDILFHSFRSL
jgi:hypothetical protein